MSNALTESKKTRTTGWMSEANTLTRRSKALIDPILVLTAAQLTPKALKVTLLEGSEAAEAEGAPEIVPGRRTIGQLRRRRAPLSCLGG